MSRMRRTGLCLITVLLALAPMQAQSTWRFAVSGDSRNCGDVVMPAIAAGVSRDHGRFYWHLGDFRAIYDFDQDLLQEPPYRGKRPNILDYEQNAWDDFLQSQIAPFETETVPVFLSIGNHELIPPKTRAEFLAQFADWLDRPILQKQRLQDNPHDHRLKTWYHWREDGIDFIDLDNASPEQFDSEQMKWFRRVLARAVSDPAIRSIVVGMHAALPDSLASGHSMNNSPAGEQSGRAVYELLLDARNRGHKNVYLLASHSHFYMANVYNSAAWKQHGGVLPGWIVGTAGAVRYPLPEDSAQADAARTNVYGYLLGTVNPPGQPAGTIHFEFREVKERDVPGAVVNRYTPSLVHFCFAENSEAGQGRN